MKIKCDDLIARYNAGDESVWIAKNTACYSEGQFLGNDGMTVNADQLPRNVVWKESSWLCLGYEACKFVSQEFLSGQDGQDVTIYSVVERTDR